MHGANIKVGTRVSINGHNGRVAHENTGGTDYLAEIGMTDE